MSLRDLDGWTVLFDLDGTLVDSAPDLVGTLNRLLVEEAPATPEWEAVRDRLARAAATFR